MVTHACGKKKLTERSGGISTIVKFLLKRCSSLQNQLTVDLFRNQSRFKRSAVSQGCSENDDRRKRRPDNADRRKLQVNTWKRRPENEDPLFWFFFLLYFSDYNSPTIWRYYIFFNYCLYLSAAPLLSSFYPPSMCADVLCVAMQRSSPGALLDDIWAADASSC